MYTPSAFVMDDLPTLHAFMQQHSFATVVSQQNDESHASHLPLLLDSSIGKLGRLTGHMAKANNQWKAASDQPVLVIFNGPHAYITPSWYSEKNVVPTWNYTAVHVRGTLRLETDPSKLRDIVQEYVNVYEAPLAKQWSMDSADSDFIDNLTAAIVGFTIDIERIEGKWKLSQNHTEERQQRVIAGLQKRKNPGDVEIAELMQNNANL